MKKVGTYSRVNQNLSKVNGLFTVIFTHQALGGWGYDPRWSLSTRPIPTADTLWYTEKNSYRLFCVGRDMYKMVTLYLGSNKIFFSLLYTCCQWLPIYILL